MAFSSQNVLSEFLGFAVLWGASWWKQLPQFYVDDVSSVDVGAVLGVHKSTLYRVAAAVSLVIFQLLLVGADATSRWVTPLISIGVFALVRLTHQFDPTSIRSYTLLSPTSWKAPKVDTKEPSILLVMSAVASLLLLWTDIRSIHSVSSAFFLLASGVGFFTFLAKANGATEEVTEKTGTNTDSSRKLVRNVAAVGAGCSLVLVLLAASSLRDSVNFLVIFETCLKAAQALGLVFFASENALAASSIIALAEITVVVLEEPLTFPGIGSLLAFCGTAVQTVLTAPKSNDKRFVLFALLFIPGVLLPIASNFSGASSPFRSGSTAPLTSWPDTPFAQVHPVQKLHKKWTQFHEDKLARQSKTIEEAVAEYHRRYSRNPPLGFEKWFTFAKDRNYLLIDEFDTLMTSMKPFWDVTPTDLLARMKKANEDGEQYAELEVIKSNVTRMSWDHWYTGPVVQWFEIFRPLDILPDFNFTMNALDEPRTVFYPTHMGSKENRNLDRRAPVSVLDKNNVTWTNIQHTPLYPEVAPACPNGGYPEVDDESSWTLSSHSLNFMDAGTAKQDVCFSRSLRTEHGFFRAPTSMRVTHNVVPVFSQAVPQRYSDILFPTPFYYNAEEDDIRENEKDIAWEKKSDQIYWAGSSTGGWHTVDNWKHIHRNRISLMTRPDSLQPVTLLKRTLLGKWQPFQSWWGAISNYFNVKVTRLVQCEESACHAMEQIFNLTMQSGSTTLGYKYVLDMDGNSYTGRYYRLMRSASCVVKSTVFREWHDDILVPWVHYIPLSNSGKEFGEMMRYLLTESEGDAIGRSIGAGGKDWMTQALRKEDMEVYALRVFMEYARLFDEARETNVFNLDDYLASSSN